MSDSVSTTTPRGPRHKHPQRPKRRNGDTPTTPGRSGTPRHATLGDRDAPGYHSSSGRLQQPRNANNAYQSERPSAISSLDGAASPSLGSRPIPIQPRDENQNRFSTPAKQAYAGPTFHASPAPSSLPMPKFFSKSLPPGDSPSPAPEPPRTVDSPVRTVPASPSPAPTADPTPVRAPVHREASPLDMLFNAHRAEQARLKLGESARPSASRNPLPQAQSIQSNPAAKGRTITSPFLPTSPIERHQTPRNGARINPSGKEIFMMEVDGAESGVEQEPQKTLSFEDRIRAVQAQSGNSRAAKAAAMDEEQRLAKSIALKQFLKGHSEEPGQSAPVQPQSRGSRPSPAQGVEPAPPDVKAMEANLKKLLKLT